MSTQRCRAILLGVGEPARVVEIEAGLRGLQCAIGGLIENFARIPLGRGTGRTADLWHDDESRLKDLPENRTVILPDYFGDIAGPILITAADEGNGETYSLKDDEIALLLSFVEMWPQADLGEGGPQ